MGTESQTAFDDKGDFEAAFRDEVIDDEPTPELEPEGGDDTGEEDQGRAKDDGKDADPAKDDADEPSDDGQDDAGEPAQPRQRQPRIPLARLQEEADKRRDAEVRAAQAEERSKGLEQRLSTLERQLRQPQQREPEKPVEKPDPLQDPDGFEEFVTRRLESQFTRRMVAASFEEAHDKHGQKFEAAFNALQSAYDNGDSATRDRIVNSANPGRTLMKWFDERETVREINGDLAGYRDRIAKETREALMKDPEFRKELMASLKDEAAGGTQNGRPRTETRLPSLNQASGGTRNDAADRIPESDGELFRDALRR